MSDASVMQVIAVLLVIFKSVLLELTLWMDMVTRLVVIVLDEVFAITKKEHARVSLAFMAPDVNIRQLFSKF
jgi:hypothetical protein